jgi:hypothetical protein
MDQSTTTELRHALRTAGFSPLPCEGKRPAPMAWQQKFDVGAAEIDLWERV